MKIIKVGSILLLMLFLAACSSTPKIDDKDVSSQIQEHYDNDLEISVDFKGFLGMGIVSLPAHDYFQASDIVVADKSISGNEATIIARVKFTMKESQSVESANGQALLKYFGNSDFLTGSFEQERKFLFRQYESGTWRFEKELDAD